MSNRRRMTNVRRIDLVREARAGLIPESDNLAEERLARMNLTERVIRSVKPYLGSLGRVSDDQAITDILASLRHYCDCKGLAFRKLDNAASALYVEEKADEAAWAARLGI
jgi:hypothetical protein